MKKFISIFMTAVLLCTALVSCGGGSQKDSTSAEVTVTVEADGTKIIENVKVTVSGIEGAAPLAIDAIIAALEDNDITYDIGEFAGYDRIEKIDEYGIDGGDYIWELYLNGDDEPAPGRLALVEIENEDTLLLKRNAGVEETATESTEETTTVPPQAVETVDDGYDG